MRVIGGTHRSRKLLMVDSVNTRETKDRVKETLFNMIGPYQSMNRVLDLFAGSGSLGIEAISRGANNAVFVEQSKQAIDVIKKNINIIGLSSSSSVCMTDAFAYIKNASQPFDVIFLDPPYGIFSLEDILKQFGEAKLLSNDGLIVILTDQFTTLKEPSQFEITKEKRVTRTKIIFLKWRN